MKRLYFSHSTLSLTALILSSVLLIPSLACFGETNSDSQQLVSLPSLRLQLAVPVGWTVQTDLGSWAARLIPSEPDWWPVELVAWSTPDTELTVAKAAAGHESLLGQRWDYQRQHARPFTTEAGQPALQVTGKIFTANEAHYGCIFAVYVVEGKYYVLGTFYQPDHEAAVREVFAPLMHSVRRLPEVRGPERPAPPSLPTPKPLSPLNLTQRYRNPSGLSMDIPKGWQTSLKAGIFHAYTSAPRAGIFVWPVLTELDEDAPMPEFAQVADRLLLSWEHLAQVVFTEKAQRLEPSHQSTIYLAQGDLTVAETPVAAAVALYMEKQRAILTAAYAPAQQFDELMPDLAALLTSVSVEPHQKATGRAPELLTWSSQHGHLTGQVPAGWQIHGGVRDYNGYSIIDIEGQFAGPPRLEIAWKQPYTPFFRQLTPLLRGLGRREGEKYQDYSDEDPLAILSPLAPTDFVVSYLLPQAGISQRHITVHRTVPRLGAGLLQPTAARGALVQIADDSAQQQRLCTYIVATADLPIGQGSFRWQAAYLMAAGPSSSAYEALEALYRVVRTTVVTNIGQGESTVRRLLQQARQVVAETQPATTPQWASLLGPAFKPSPTGGLTVPADALKCWRQSVIDSGGIPPEENDPWWQQLGKHSDQHSLKNNQP